MGAAVYTTIKVIWL